MHLICYKLKTSSTYTNRETLLESQTQLEYCPSMSVSSIKDYINRGVIESTKSSNNA